MLRKFVTHPGFDRIIMLLILANAILLGAETLALSPDVLAFIRTLDTWLLGCFVGEIILRLMVHRWKFFQDPWRLFDLVIVAISLVPATGAFSVLRALRVLRVLRMISVVPELRRVVNGLLKALPGLGAVITILALIFYVGSVMATNLFGPAFPEWFGTIASSCYSLFQIMTLESWSMGIVRPVMERFPYAWLFFLPFILVTTFTMLNLFIAVIVSAMQSDTESAAIEREERGHGERQQLLSEIVTLHRKIDLLQAHLSRLPSNVPLPALEQGLSMSQDPLKTHVDRSGFRP